MERLGVAAPRVDLLEEEGRVRQRAAGAAVLRRDEEPAEALGLELRHEFLGVGLAVLEALPVVGRELVHEPRDRREEEPLGLTRRVGHAKPPLSSGP